MTYLVCSIAAVYVAALVVGARYFAKREGYYSTVVVFGISAFVYYLAIPLEMALFGEEIEAAGDIVFISPSQQVQIMTMGLIAFVAFVAGYWLSRFSPFQDEGPEEELAAKPAERLPSSLIALTMGSLVALVVVFAPQLLSMSTYETAYETAYQNPLLSLLSTYAMLGFALVAAIMMIGGRRFRLVFALVAAIPLFFWGVFSSNKDPILIALLALAAYFLGKRSRSPRLLLAITVSAALFILASPVFSMYRAGYTLSEAWSEYYFGVSKTDPRGPMIPLTTVLSGDQEMALGETYVSNVILWIPKFVWPDRPLDLAESFARDNMSGWSPGQVLGYSLLAEAYVNFRWFGPLIQYFLIGLLWGKAWGFVQKALRPVSVAYWRATYGVFGFYLLIMMHRGPTVATTKTMLQFLVPLILLRYVFDGFQTRSVTPAPSTLTGGESGGQS